MMKKRLLTIILSLVAVLCLTFALSACGEKKTECEKNGHSFSTEWLNDATDHWHKCANCNEVSDKAAHVYDNDVDATCNTCGYERAAHTAHTAGTVWENDETNHWRECTASGCEEKLDTAAHVYDNDADTTCNVCGYERAVVPTVKTYTITFVTNGGSHVAQIEAEAGDEITVPAAPTKSGERFVGWYESTDGGTTLKPDAFVFGYMPSKNITLYAKWQDAVIGSWETYQVVMPAGTVINLGEEFTFLGTTLSEDLFNLTVEETSLTLTMTIGKSTMSDSATYTKTDGVYVATLTIMGDTVYTLTTYDEENDRLFCEIRDKEGEGYTTYYRLILKRVNGEA